MRQMSLAVVCALFGATAVVACGFYSYLDVPVGKEPPKEEPAKKEPAKKESKDVVKEMMIMLHKGEKSPLARTRAEVAKDQPNWDQLAKDVKLFGEMSELVKKNVGGYRSPQQYISSVADLTKATKDKDHSAAKKAFAGLSASCVSCHFYNDPNK